MSAARVGAALAGLGLGAGPGGLVAARRNVIDAATAAAAVDNALLPLWMGAFGLALVCPRAA